MDPVTGEISDLENLRHLDNSSQETAKMLRDTVFHYLSVSPSGNLKECLSRIVREQAFTVLNRLCALRMAEARGILLESIANGYKSKGFQLYARLTGTALGETGDAYRCYLFSVFDEFALDMAVLFDRFSTQGRLFPREPALLALLDLINQPDMAVLWAEDETIGWIYQYFNSAEERRQMRAESQAPRNSRELAVRNQFFTPRYVVEFLTDNTLGRIWYEMTQGKTGLKKCCRYLVCRPNEIFLSEGEEAPEQDEPTEGLSQEELFKQPVYIRFRHIKDPREIRMLDPACGSMHFGLYAFDLYEKIYEEAWELEDQYGAGVFERSKSLKPLCETYKTKEDLMCDVPRLIIEHNIHGIDIDPRAVQIAGLSLWLRAQRTWQECGIKPGNRPQIQKSNIVCAEPMPGDREMLQGFTEQLKPRVLGQIFEKVFEKMELAGEAGSLLKIEEEIEEIIAQAYDEFKKEVAHRRKTSSALFPELLAPLQTSLFDFSDLPDKTQFWSYAEQKVIEALHDYAEQAEGEDSNRKRLFAQDAAKGFAFIDILRKRYDVVLMNPPFGEFSKTYKPAARKYYKNSYNDILGAFIDCYLSYLLSNGRLGAITSRTCFFLSSFKNWRVNVVLRQSAIAVMADLGQGVMDDAMVEAAAYVLQKSRPVTAAPFIRAIAEPKVAETIKNCIESVQRGEIDQRLFFRHQLNFYQLLNAPFVYWVDEKIIERLKEFHIFESIADVKQGLATGDDFRFVRAVWEVPPENTVLCYYPSNGQKFCQLDDPIVQAYFQRREKGIPIWAFHVKAGVSQPWFSPITLMVKWAKDGAELHNFVDNKGKLRSRPQNVAFYFRPGFSWTRRAVRFYPYVIPGGCIPSVSRYMAFPSSGREYEALGVVSSRLSSAFMRFYAEFWQRPNYLVENLKMLSCPELSDEVVQHFKLAIPAAVENRREAYLNQEPFQEFLLPAKIKSFCGSFDQLSFDKTCLLGEQSEQYIAQSFGFTPEQSNRIERDLIEAIRFQDKETSDEAEGEADDKDQNILFDISERTQNEALVSYVIGCLYGRWDIRMSLDPSLAPKLNDPFDPLPVCPPGMLVGPDGLPVKPGSIVSEELLRARPDVNTLPSQDAVMNTTISDSDYPLRISWSGILVDDEGHSEDIVVRVREALEVIWKDKAEDIEQEACQILGVNSLRDYFCKPANFFDEHLKRYSKSRRQAPIYWPLSIASGSYTLWLYYHRLTDQTLYTCVNDFVGPKIKEVAEAAGQLRKKQQRTMQEEQELESLVDLEQELKDFRDELLRVAVFWKPDLNDGVQINAAPLWRLFRLNRWQNKLKETWEKLEKGAYDWAHLAYSIWPDRVKEKCRYDKSLAIAHDLEELYDEDYANSIRKGGRRKRKR
jgi:hypothetical protein